MHNLIIAHFRDIAELSIEELSQKTGLSERTLARVEDGKMNVPPILVTFYSDYFNVKTSVLDALLRDQFESRIERKITTFVQKILLSYLNLGKRMESFEEKS